MTGISSLRGREWGGVNLVAGFRPELWREAAADDAPPDVEGFHRDVVGVDGFRMPATQHDAVLWISGMAYDVVFDVSRDAMAALAGLASVAHEPSSWPYRRDRDLTGFVDGNENPTLTMPRRWPSSLREIPARWKHPAPPEVITMRAAWRRSWSRNRSG